MDSSQADGFRPRLQGLRALAVLLVVVYHLSPGFAPSGYIGVDVFFVLSGFLITRLLLREYYETGSIKLRVFYLRRLRRLLPALVAMILAVVLIAWALLSANEFATLVRSAPYAAFWVSNFFFTFRSVGYFDELSQQDLFLHTWSLAVEEQFYLIWPAFLLILLAVITKGPGAPQKQVLVWGTVLASLASLGFSLAFTRAWPEFSFYMLPSRIWQFGLGGLIFMLSAQAQNFGHVRHIPNGLIVSGLAAIVAAGYVIPAHAVYPGAWSLIPTLGAGAVILGDMVNGRRTGFLLGNRCMVWIGDRSYAIYLWHFPLIGLMAVIAPEDPLPKVVVPVLLTLLLAHLTYHLVELPFWKGRHSRIEPRPAFLTALLASVLVAAVGLRLPDPVQMERNELVGEAMWRADIPELYRFPCDSWYFSAELVPCIFGDDNVDPQSTTVVLGDSIGLQWFSLFESLHAGENLTLVVLTKSACPIVDQPIFYQRISSRYEICEQWRESAVEWIEALQPARLIIGSAASYAFEEEEWRAGSERILSRLAGAAGQTRVILGTPRLSFDGPGCVARFSPERTQVERSRCRSAVDWDEIYRVRSALKLAAAGLESVAVVDFSNSVCPGRDCNAISEDGIVVFRDSQHLTDSFVRSRKSELAAKLDLRLDQR